MTIKLPTALIDEPTFLAENWDSYQHFKDPTLLPFNVLTYPSFNCTIPSFDKVVPDKGKTLIGQDFTENVPIIGNKQKFKNLGGIEMEARVFESNDPDLKDVIEVGYENTRLVYTSLVGGFDIGEPISGGTSGASAVISSDVTTVLSLSDILGTFVVGETITGLGSGATATVVLAPEFHFYQITENVNPIPYGLHEYYFAEWFEANLNPADSKNLPRLIWVNGYRDNSTPVKGAVYSWTGGIAVVTSLTGTTLTINPATTWRSFGFTEDAVGDAFIIVNGVSYQLSNPADLDTSTIDVSSTTGISVGDTAFSKIETDIAPVPFDVCLQNKNFMFYGNWTMRKLYQSNKFNTSSIITITQFQALQNDLIIVNDASYTGSGSHVYKVTIDSITPESDSVSFTGAGNNDFLIDTSGFTGNLGQEYTYVFTVVATASIFFTGICTFANGEAIVGATSGAIGIIRRDPTTPAGNAVPIQMISGVFDPSELVTGSVGGATNTTDGINFGDNWYTYSLDNVPVYTNSAPSIMNSGLAAQNDGLLWGWNQSNGHEVGDTWTLTLNTGLPDTFQYQIDNGAPVTGIPITGGSQSLGDGIEIQFVKTTGHTVGDYWDITVNQSIERAWDNFYSTIPTRKPGEGYIYTLSSNFWAMDTQEESVYVNGSYGEWSVIDTILSANLQSETVSLTPLKQAGANKVLYPYLTGHLDDKLVYINTRKELNTIGREPLLEKPQTGYLSDPVKLDFISCSFIDGRIKYNDKKLFISSPEQGVMHCLDNARLKWQPPKKFPEMGLLSIIGDDTVCHSNIRNRSFTLFTNSAGDNGENYEVSIRTAITSVGNRWSSKFSSMSFTEGQITGNPPLIHTVYLGVGGCGAELPHTIEPIVCAIPDTAPFGEGSFGSHSNGSDLGLQGSHFNEIWKKYSPVMQYYFLSIGITCITKSHTYSILSTGMNCTDSQSGNNDFVAPSNLAINQV